MSISAGIDVGLSLAALLVSALAFCERRLRPFSPKFTIGAPVLTMCENEWQALGVTELDCEKEAL